MKEKIIYIVPFVLAFIFVSAAIIYLNSSFKNIFKFDFSAASQISLPKQVAKATEETAIDSTKISQTQDSVKQKNVQTTIDTTVAPNSAKVDQAIAKNTNSVKKSEEKDPSAKSPPKDVVKNEPNSKTEPEAVPINKELPANAIEKPDYKNWVKQTVKLYESMESKKAAKIIQGYSDNIARDILFTMKKKKAAEILAEFRPEAVTRIISVN